MPVQNDDCTCQKVRWRRPDLLAFVRTSLFTIELVVNHVWSLPATDIAELRSIDFDWFQAAVLVRFLL